MEKETEELIEELYEDISFLGFQATYYRNSTYVQNCRELVPKIQDFVQWFLEHNTGLEEGIYQNLADILKDCGTAFLANDQVLLMDALEEGIAGYLEVFLREEYFKEKETAYVGRAKNQEP